MTLSTRDSGLLEREPFRATVPWGSGGGRDGCSLGHRRREIRTSRAGRNAPDHELRTAWGGGTPAGGLAGRPRLRGEEDGDSALPARRGSARPPGPQIPIGANGRSPASGRVQASQGERVACARVREATGPRGLWPRAPAVPGDEAIHELL